VGERGSGKGRLLVVGAGLMGTSLALAARQAGYDVWIDDTDADRLSLALSLGAGSPREASPTTVDVAVAAVPPATVPLVINGLISSGVAPTVTHLASVQHDPQLQVEARNPRFSGFVGSHPIAGRERSGPHHASADLFERRPWIVCPTEASSQAAISAVTALAQACGALVTEMTAEDHDVLFARLSHVPQLLASALAASLLGLDRAAVSLAGAGLRDTSRLAESDPRLWAEIVAANPQPVAAALRAVTEPLADLADSLERQPAELVAAAVAELVERGRHGRDLLAGKHGQQPVRWETVAVVVPDAPGRLAQLLVDAAAAGVNVEDIRVDHSPGQPFGIVELDVAPGRGDPLEADLAAGGWSATASGPPAE
jgi:prephenate dehydrogenase